MTQPALSLYDLTFDEIQAALQAWGEPTFRARQIWDWLYRRLAHSYAEMTNLPQTLRDQLAAVYLIGRLTPQIDLLSTDGWTRKLLFRLPDQAQVETVLMEYETRNTVCVSTQAGCGMGCTFCATGQGGLQRNLTAGEIVEQVLFFERELRRTSHQPLNTGHLLTNVVLMGMGEPFANYPALIAALDRLSDPIGYNFGARRITVSTVGLVPMIERFTQERLQVNLAVSLHAATNGLRSSMLPINRRYPLEVLIPACRAYTTLTHRRLSFEWAMIAGVNDTPEQAHALAQLIKDLLCHVNLIPLNPTTGYGGTASTRERIAAFRAILDEQHIPNTLRVRRGIDIHAGCGQLRQAQRAAS